MSRMTRFLVPFVVCVGLFAATASQAHEPRGLTFSQGGGFRYAPREHHVAVYGGYPQAGSYGWSGGYYGGGYPVYGGSPWMATWGYPVVYQPIVSPGYYWPQPLPMSQIPHSPLVAPANALPAQISPWTDFSVPKADPVERPVLPSSAAARLKSMNYQADGDQNLRQQLWQRAYVNYRQAVNVADDQASAHLRYGIVFAVLRRYDRAEMEFKRAVYIDPSLPTSEFTLEKLFGPDSQLVRSSIIARVADWVNEDIADPQRLFVMGVLLHFNQDERAQELFSAAHQLTGGASHITAFLRRVGLPAQDGRPDANDEAAPALPPAPLPAAPMPDAPQPTVSKRPARIIDAPPAPGLDVDAVKPPAKPAAPEGPVLLPPPGE